MLIDINSNVGHWPFQQTNCNSCESLLERMNRYDVDISVVSNMNGIFYKDSHAANEELHSELQSDERFKDRFIPFAILNPTFAGWKRDLEICAKRFTVKGIRLYPQYHDYEVTDPACFELVRSARDMGLVVAFTIRMVDSRCRSWLDIPEEWSLRDFMPVLKEVPDAKYFFLNIANGMNLNDEERSFFCERDVLFDTSGRNISDPGMLMKNFGKERFAFGTHSPILDYLTGLLRVESLRENEADKPVRELLRSGNAERMLGL